MATHLIFIVLAAAFFHALWNATVKLSDDKLLSLAAMQITILILVLPLIPIVGLPHTDSWIYIIASAALHFGYYLSLASAYRYGDFAQAYPVARGSAPIWVTVAGVFVLGETLAGAELISLLGIICGIMIFATRRLGSVLHDHKALGYALLTSCFIGAYTIVDGIGGRLSQNIPAYMVWLSIIDGVPLVVYAMWRRPLGEIVGMRLKWRAVLFASVLGLAAYWMVVWAMSVAPIALVSALRETSIIIAALIGAYYFKERSGKRRIVASIVIFMSIVLLGWSS